ncbi:uncharacterized protein LOC109202411 isoform X2 [Oreochromis niloticus]|uniref:uncharacterized protein LOC109202411 isoform X2 n=1 Tax=Oreochromis niloticus TaxID=8128 RepID=UPI000DF29FD4|nr:uncharacterized protein LOC109202411 isoform X2 [Oreochromis niloticus]
MTSGSTMMNSQNIVQATEALERDMQAWDLSDSPDSPPPALLFQTPPPPPPSPQLLQDPTGSGNMLRMSNSSTQSGATQLFARTARVLL